MAFPKRIYVYEDIDGDDTYLICEKALHDITDPTGRKVATYELIEVGEVETTTVYRPLKGKRT